MYGMYGILKSFLSKFQVIGITTCQVPLYAQDKDNSLVKP